MLKAPVLVLVFVGTSVWARFVIPVSCSADGQRFLMIRKSEQQTGPIQINAVLNWFEELKHRVPANET